MPDNPTSQPAPHKRRLRYRGTHPRRFEEKYKEHDPLRHPETAAKVIASGKTVAGTHRPILLEEVLDILAPKAGELAVDCTLGYGGHSQEILPRIQPGGFLLGLDADPIELPKTEARLRSLGFGPTTFIARRSNFAGLPQVLADTLSNLGPRAATGGADIILADLGLSSMQIDDPARGFSWKQDGALDMRMNPRRGQPASFFLQRVGVDALASLLEENADETDAAVLAPALAGKFFPTTHSLAAAIRNASPHRDKERSELAVRRVFQALRIALNDEFSALEAFLRNLPVCLNPGGRVAILTFHSGEDRRVKKSFELGLREGVYAEIAPSVIRPGSAERRSNPRSTSAKLRWARKLAE